MIHLAFRDARPTSHSTVFKSRRRGMRPEKKSTEDLRHHRQVCFFLSAGQYKDAKISF